MLAIAVIVILVAAGALTYRRWEGQPPQAEFGNDFAALGRQPSVALTVSDAGTGLKQVRVVLKQKEQEVVLVEESFERSAENASRGYDIGKLIAEKYKVQEGPATLSVSASDHSYRGFFGGNTMETTKDFTFDLYPPMLELLSGQHYINQGGSECAVYRVSDDAVASGVQVGPHFFPGFSVPDSPDPNMRFALFAFSYDLPAETRVKVVARDAAGNETASEPWQRVFPRAFRSRDLTVDDAFLGKVVPEIMGQTTGVQDQGDLVKTFVEINSKLRRENHETLAELSKQSGGEFLWKDAFLQLSNSQVESFFADRRTYFYNGERIDRQDHVGFDLSVVQRYPIEAANRGKVLFAGYFGIYGNTVLLDHGAGLVSLYGHMSSIDVKTGDVVEKKQTLGRSGATGLAGGDHLHFGLFLHGVPVNPVEWWDAKWVEEHVLSRLRTPAPPA